MREKGVHEIRRILLDFSIDFSNISQMAEAFLKERCSGCHTSSFVTEDILIKKTCSIVSEAIVVLNSVSETLRSSSCIGEEKSIIAQNVIKLACDIKIFLMTRSHIINSGFNCQCQCNNHNNIDSLIGIIFSVIDM